MAFRIRRGLLSNLGSMDPPPVEGELFYTTDTKGLYVGDDEGVANLVSSAVVTVNGYFGAVDLVTDDIPEDVGATNKWFTDERAQDAVWAALEAGNTYNTGITFSYNDGSGRLSASVAFPGSGTVNTGTTNSLAYYTGNTNEVDDIAELKWNTVSKILTVNNSQIKLIGSLPTQAVINSKAFVDGGPLTTTNLYQRARGSEETPTVVQAEDYIHADVFQAYDGSDYATSAAISVKVQQVTGTPGLITGAVVFNLTDSTGSFNEAVRIDPLGRTTIGPYFDVSTGTGALSVVQTKTSDLDPTISVSNIFGNALGPTLNLAKSRGTQSTYAAVQTNDVLGDIVFAGKDTQSSRLGFAVGARIRSKVDNTVGTNTVPANLTISVADSAGTLIDTATVNSINGLAVLHGALKLPVYATTSARDTALASPQAGMLVFIETGTKIQINTNNTTGGWVDLN